MAEGYVHTTYADGRWTNSIEGDGGGPLGTFETKDAATRAGRGEARRRHTEHVIHNQDGTIAERNSDGDDPTDRPTGLRPAGAERRPSSNWAAPGGSPALATLHPAPRLHPDGRRSTLCQLDERHGEHHPEGEAPGERQQQADGVG